MIILRIILITTTILVSAWMWIHYDLKFTFFFLLTLLILQIVELIRFTNRTNHELKKFLDALRYGDYSVSFSGARLGGSFKELDQSFSEVIESIKSSRAEKQSQSELLKLALENLRLGLIIVDYNGSIILMNAAARDMLGVPHFYQWKMLQKKKPQFANSLGDFSFEGRKLIEMDSPAGVREFFLDLNHIALLGQVFHIISFSDLKNEIEQKEIEAWHKLIRILSHEVMNSVTPVTSLSETVRNMLTDDQGEPIPIDQLDQGKVDDIILALNTIIRRSKGMLNFVDDYRKLTKLPAPKFEVISVQNLFEEVCELMKEEARMNNVQLEINLINPRLAVNGDRKMIEQTLINLIGNALHAMEERGEGTIVLSANMGDSHLMISVADNGPGIPQDIMPSIFIPFFSTRKNGTGIGLTLSKNIMRLHKGSISVRSNPGEGSTFELAFNI